MSNRWGTGVDCDCSNCYMKSGDCLVDQFYEYWEYSTSLNNRLKPGVTYDMLDAARDNWVTTSKHKTPDSDPWIVAMDEIIERMEELKVEFEKYLMASHEENGNEESTGNRSDQATEE